MVVVCAWFAIANKQPKKKKKKRKSKEKHDEKKKEGAREKQQVKSNVYNSQRRSPGRLRTGLPVQPTTLKGTLVGMAGPAAGLQLATGRFCVPS